MWQVVGQVGVNKRSMEFFKEWFQIVLNRKIKNRYINYKIKRFAVLNSNCITLSSRWRNPKQTALTGSLNWELILRMMGSNDSR